MERAGVLRIDGLAGDELDTLVDDAADGPDAAYREWVRQTASANGAGPPANAAADAADDDGPAMWCARERAVFWGRFLGAREKIAAPL